MPEHKVTEPLALTRGNMSRDTFKIRSELSKEKQHKSIISLEDTIQDSHVGKLRSAWKPQLPVHLLYRSVC